MNGAIPIAAHFARVTFLSDNRADLPRLQTPTLILQCTDDMIAPPEVSEKRVMWYSDGLPS